MFTHRLGPPPTLSWPNVDLFTWNPRDLLKPKVNLVRLSLQCPIALLERRGPNSHYCFPINSTLLDRICRLHDPVNNLSHKRLVHKGTKFTPSCFVLLWKTQKSEPGREGKFTPSLFARQAQVPCELCRGGGPERARCLWLRLVQRCRGCVACETCIHCSVVELNRAWKALQAWKAKSDKEREWERFIGKERKAFNCLWNLVCLSK